MKTINKHKTRLIKLVFIAFLFISISSCDKDLYQEDTKVEAKINYVTIDQVPFLIPKIQEFNPDYAFLSSSNKKNVNKETLNLNLDLNHILEYVLSNGLKSYSINIIKEFELNEDKYYENLHLYEKEGEIESFILKYNALDDFKEFNLQDFVGTIEIYDLNYELQGISEIDENRICHNKIINSGWHFWFLANGTIIIWYDNEYTTPISSTGEGSGGGNGGGVDGPSPSNPGTISGPTNPSSTGGNGGVPPVVPNIPTPQQLFVYSLNNSDLTDHITQFYELSTISQTTILNYVTANNFTGTNVTRVRNYLVSLMNNTTLYNTLISNPQIQPSLFNYLILNNFENPSNTFVNQCLSQISNNPGVFTSITPFLIEKQIDDSELDDCTKGILNKLKQNHTIAKLMARFDNPESDFRLLMSQVPNLLNSNGQIVYGETEQITNLQFQIKLNSNYYNNTGATHIGKAGTILHEIIHALIMSIYSNSGNTSLNGSADFPALWNYYVTNIQGQGTLTNELQHQWMTTYQNVIQEALIEYANTTNTNPPAGQTIQQFCYYLSWNGIYTGQNGIPVLDSTLPMSDKIKVLLQKQAEMTNTIAPNNTLPSNNPTCN